MAVTAISGPTFISDTLIFTRDILRSNITDPLSRNGSLFVFTSYPQEDVKYPIITVKENGFSQVQRLGMQSEAAEMRLPIEVRVWARNEKEKDTISQNVYHFLKGAQFGAGSITTDAELHDFTLTSTVNVDEDGRGAIKSKVMEYSYLYINQA